MNNTPRIALAVLTAGAVFTLLGCASGLPSLRPVTYATPGEARIYVSTNYCPHEKATTELSALVTAILTGVASQALTNFGTALQKGAEGGTLPSSIASRNITPAPGHIPKCLVIVRGAFEATDDAKSPLTGAGLWGSTDGQTPQEFKSRVDSLKIDSVFRLDHVIALRILAAPNDKALTFSPVYTYVKQSLDGSTEGSRDLSIALKFDRVGQTASAGSTVLLANRQIGKIAPVLEQDAETKRFPKEAPWFASFHAEPKKEANSPKATGEAATTAPGTPAPKTLATAPPTSSAAPNHSTDVVGGGGSSIAPVSGPVTTGANLFSKEKDAVPVTVSATVVETRPTREGLAFIASVFGTIKPKIEQEINKFIDPSIEKAAEDEATLASMNAQVLYDTAIKAAKLAVLAYCKLQVADPTSDAGKSELISKSSDARIGQVKANVEALKSNVQPLPYPNLVIVSDQKPADNPGCK